MVRGFPYNIDAIGEPLASSYIWRLLALYPSLYATLNPPSIVKLWPVT